MYNTVTQLVELLTISKELYQFCVDQKYAGQALIAKWRKVCKPTGDSVSLCTVQCCYRISRAPDRKKELYQFCVDQKYAHQALIAKWRKEGYKLSPMPTGLMRLQAVTEKGPRSHPVSAGSLWGGFSVSLCTVQYCDTTGRAPDHK